jgi:catechol 2,3-dioxygenase
MKQPEQPENDYTMHAAMEIGIVSLTVADLERSLRFYEGVLGCTTLAREGDSAVVGAEHPLLLLTERRNARPCPAHTTGLYHVALLLPGRVDLARALHHLLALSYPVREIEDHGVSEAIYLADPDGNGIELYRDRPRSAWPWQHGRLEATEPSVHLEPESLLAELDEASASWHGLPPYTRVGHVHLKAASLESSFSFYQGALGMAESITVMDGARFFAAGGYHHHIACNVWSSLDAPTPPPDALGLRFFTLVLPEQEEVTRLVGRARSAGVPVVAFGSSYLLRDPAGSRILLTAQSLRRAEEVLALQNALR